jgi:hypothetical protein
MLAMRGVVLQWNTVFAEMKDGETPSSESQETHSKTVLCGDMKALIKTSTPPARTSLSKFAVFGKRDGTTLQDLHETRFCWEIRDSC